MKNLAKIIRYLETNDINHKRRWIIKEYFNQIMVVCLIEKSGKYDLQKYKRNVIEYLSIIPDIDKTDSKESSIIDTFMVLDNLYHPVNIAVFYLSSVTGREEIENTRKEFERNKAKIINEILKT